MMGINKNEGSYFLLYAFVPNATFHSDHTTLPVSSYAEYYRALYKVLDLDNDKRPDLMEPLVMFTDFEYLNYSEEVSPSCLYFFVHFIQTRTTDPCKSQ